MALRIELNEPYAVQTFMLRDGRQTTSVLCLLKTEEGHLIRKIK
jgi:hypothetical protein